MEKKMTRRIIGILVVVALVIILLPLMNLNDAQTNIQTTEVKAPPFPDPQSDSTTNTTVAADTTTNTTATAEPEAKNNSMSLHSIIENIVSPKSATTAKTQKTPVVSENQHTVIVQGIPDVPAPQSVAKNTPTMLTPNAPQAPGAAEENQLAQEQVLASNSATDGEEEVEQAENDVTIMKGATMTAENNQPKIDQAIATTKTDAMPEQHVAVAEKIATVEKPTVAATTPALVTQAPVIIKTVKTTTTVQTTPTVEAAAKPVTKSLITEETAEAKLEPALETPTQERVIQVKSSVAKAAPAKTSAVKLASSKTKHVAATTDDEAEIVAAKQTAWVVQMGSFKNKTNAERLTNTLRAKGYKAFTFETKSNGQTRVYVGPQFKQVAAATTATKIESDLNMHGIVVSFKPLEL
jgi:DedD protein